ncbi:MAG TPA: LLM class flavin-dependent oxidoreductase, partial [Ktedonobacteraceae bacterium]|nr:LLM class flavin-dependent oxidoreductase [Ktedonobacteraceae bacterium]
FIDLMPADIQAIKAFIEKQRTQTTPFDIVMEGETPGDNSEKAALIIRPLAQVGLTWWLEAVWSTPESQGGLEGMRTRILQGPPRIEE